MSQLHPFKESFDDRKDLIVEDTTGRKEIDYIDDEGNKYEIVHIYGKAAQSFFKKNGVELNQNGGVRTFEDLVKKELGITKEYSKIGKIGSNTKNFVDFTAADRKNYIGNFLDIEDIIEKYNITNQKLKTLKKDINTVSGELSKFKAKETIENEIKQIEETIEKINSELSTLYTESGKLSANIDHSNKELDAGSSLDSLLLRINEKKTDIANNKQTKESLEKELDNINDAESVKSKLEELVSQLRIDAQVNNTNIQNTNLLLTDYKNKLATTKIELSSLGNPEDIQSLRESIKKIEAEIEELKKNIRSNEYSILISNMLKAKKDVNSYLEKFIAFTDYIEKYFSDLSRRSIVGVGSNIDYFFNEDFNETFKRQVTEARNVILSKQQLLNVQQKQRGEKEAHVCLLKNLEKRPSECNIDDCPFIKEALLHKNVLEEISVKDNEITQTKKDIELLSTTLENLQNLQTLYLNFQDAYKNVKPRDNEIYLSFISKKTLIEWVNGPISEFQVKRQEIIEKVNNAILLFNEYSNKMALLSSSNKSLSVMEGSDLSIREKYLQDISELEGNIEKLTKTLEEQKTKSIETNTNLAEQTNLLTKYNTYIQSIKNIASASTMLSTANTEFNKLSKIAEELAEYTAKEKVISSRISTLSATLFEKQKALDSLKASLSQVVILNEKLQKLNKQYDPVATVASALSPTSGIPLILMKTYLEETESIANDLLSIAFGGDFKIKFVTTEKEFSIQVQSKDNVKPDIKMASQGEVAITTISISLALIEQSIGNYNILCLDEIDGPLDASNRNNFINILNSQIEKLGIKQVFVISHNDAFDASPVDLILLKGSNIDTENTSFMEDKTVLYQY